MWSVLPRAKFRVFSTFQVPAEDCHESLIPIQICSAAGFLATLSPREIGYPFPPLPTYPISSIPPHQKPYFPASMANWASDSHPPSGLVRWVLVLILPQGYLLGLREEGKNPRGIFGFCS
uniref:Zinc finger protein 652 n=1 Tax=Anthurium amnicola TaxID=1678845 RepID=A0A1D1XXF4_9ARAE